MLASLLWTGTGGIARVAGRWNPAVTGRPLFSTQTCLDPLLLARASPRPPLHGLTPHVSGADSPCVQVRRCLSIKGAEDLLNKPHAFEISTTDDSMFFIADTDKVSPRMAAGPGPQAPCHPS